MLNAFPTLSKTRISLSTPTPPDASSSTRPQLTDSKFSKITAGSTAAALQRTIACSVFALTVTACSSVYYSAWESMGYEKRDILRGAIERVKSSQTETVEEYRDALEVLQDNYGSAPSKEGKTLTKFYEHLKAEYDQCAAEASRLKDRSVKMSQIANDLFTEWLSEAKKITSAELRLQSLRQRDQTIERFKSLEISVARVQHELSPVLTQLQDYVYFVKHNLNAQSLGSLKQETDSIRAGVERLSERVRASIHESEAFLETLR